MKYYTQRITRLWPSPSLSSLVIATRSQAIVRGAITNRAIDPALDCCVCSTGIPCPGRCRQTSLGRSCLQRRVALASLTSCLFTLFPPSTRDCESATGKEPEGVGSPPGLAAAAEQAGPLFFKTASGVKVQELAVGTGPPARDGDRVQLEYVLRRSNGYFIYATVEGVSFQPKDIPTGPLEFQLGEYNIIAGLQDAVKGMRPGGKRRALIPPALGYAASGGKSLEPQPPSYAAQRQILNHANEPLLFELQLVKIKSGL